MSHPKDFVSRYAVVLVKVASGRPIGLLIASASASYAKVFIRRFNQRIRPAWPDRRAIRIPII